MILLKKIVHTFDFYRLIALIEANVISHVCTSRHLKSTSYLIKKNVLDCVS